MAVEDFGQPENLMTAAGTVVCDSFEDAVAAFAMGLESENGGNSGVDTIMRTLQLVEGMKLETLQTGIDWSFETFPEYLDALRRLPKRLNLAAFVPHSMVRLYVMGEDAAFSRAADDAELTLHRVQVATGIAPAERDPRDQVV